MTRTPDLLPFDPSYDPYFGLNSLPNLFTGAVATVEDAQEIVDNWLAEHPVGPMSSAVPENEWSIPEEVAQAQYSFELWGAPRDYLGLIYVRKIDGYLAFAPFHGGTIYDLDAWYEATYGAYSPQKRKGRPLAPHKGSSHPKR